MCLCIHNKGQRAISTAFHTFDFSSSKMLNISIPFFVWLLSIAAAFNHTENETTLSGPKILSSRSVCLIIQKHQTILFQGQRAMHDKNLIE